MHERDECLADDGCPACEPRPSVFRGGGSSIGHVPAEKWEFDAGVVDCFDDMLARSIPQLGVMRHEVDALLRHFAAAPGSRVIDLGASLGGACEESIGKYPETMFELIECSPQMLAALRDRFPEELFRNVRVREWDLAGVESFREAAPRGIRLLRYSTVIVAVLTLQFLSPDCRFDVVADAWAALQPGGAMIVVEKVRGTTVQIDRLMENRYYGMKLANGYGVEDIARKRASLEGRLIPMTASQNEDMLRACGFQDVECFWAWQNFRAWVAVK